MQQDNSGVSLFWLLLIIGVGSALWLLLDTKVRNDALRQLHGEEKPSGTLLWFIRTVGLTKAAIRGLLYLEGLNRKLVSTLRSRPAGQVAVPMMNASPIVISCELCGQKLRLTDTHTRRKVTCASCSHSFIFEPEWMGTGQESSAYRNELSEPDIASTSSRPTSTKRLIIVSASAGAGFALVILLAVGAVHWYNKPPKHPITATFKEIQRDAKNKGALLIYVLHNHTQENFVFERLLVAYRVKGVAGFQDGTLMPFVYDTNNKDENRWVSVPMVLPAGDDVTFMYNFQNDISAIESLVLMDGDERVRIDLPKGW